MDLCECFGVLKPEWATFELRMKRTLTERTGGMKERSHMRTRELPSLPSLVSMSFYGRRGANV